MKIGVSSYSFWQYMEKGKLTQLETVKKASEMGFKSIGFSGLTPPDGMDILVYASLLKEEAQKYNMEVSAYVMGANLARKDENVLREEIEKLKHGVDIAHALGAKFFRHDVMYDYNDFRSFTTALPTIAKATRECTEYAASFGIKTMTENHGFIFQDDSRMESLVSAVNHENYGLLIDIGNFLCADCDVHKAISALANHAFLVHAKDFKIYDFHENYEGGIQTRGCNKIQGVAVGDGDVDVKRCIAILKKAGFDGNIDIEYEGLDDCIEGISRSFEFLKNIIQRFKDVLKSKGV